MRITYERDLLTRLLAEHEREPIDYVTLKKSEYYELFEEVDKADKIASGDRYWFTIEGYSIIFYLDQE